MSPLVGRLVLVASSLGFPLTQAAVRRGGQAGAVLVEAVAAGLLVRDAALIASGAPGRLRAGPAVMLYAEAAAAAVALVAGAPLLVSEGAREAAVPTRPVGREVLRRAALGVLFGLHTARFRVYLQPDHGRRPVAA